jgi:hypothetical protein
MLWILISLLLCWLIYREFRNSQEAPMGFLEIPITRPVSKPYVTVLAVLALLFAWSPVHYWIFQRYLSAKATELADFHAAKVHCNTLFDTYLDPNLLAAGHANPRTGEIGIQYPWCSRLMDYLAHPQRADRAEIASLNLFTHESMHVRGEINEAVTECEAVQRNYRAAKLLGVPDRVAKKNALAYYFGQYLQRADSGVLSRDYFSEECAPGKSLDEHLIDSTWAPPLVR